MSDTITKFEELTRQAILQDLKMEEWRANEEAIERRKRIIDQNGNSGIHYVNSNCTKDNTRVFYAGMHQILDEEETENPDTYGGELEENFTTQSHDEDVKTVAQERKATPVFSGVLKYFPNAIKEVSRCSQAGNDQHHPGTPLHWDMDKSKDEYDALARHLVDHTIDPMDEDGVLHLAKVAWRALAGLERYLTNKY